MFPLAIPSETKQSPASCVIRQLCPTEFQNYCSLLKKVLSLAENTGFATLSQFVTMRN